MAKAAKVENETFWVMKTPAWYPEFNGTEHFYDGSLPIENGIVMVPRDKLPWVRRLQIYGYDFAYDDQRDAFAKEYN